MQIPILSGTYSDNSGDYRTSYPRNMIPVPKDTSISKGYLRPADGIESFTLTTGKDRGGYNYNGTHYRVVGTSLVLINSDGTVIDKGTITGINQVTFDRSFDYLSISADGKLYLFDGTTLTQVTDTDLGVTLDHIWIDGYFMTTDGESLVVTELNDPFAVNPLKYGSSEADPDPIKAILKHRNEVYALNRDTIEVFRNVGGSNFPFQRISSAQIQRGVVGTHACCVFNAPGQEVIAFLGGKGSEPSAIWLGINGSSSKISTREIDTIIQEYPDWVLASVLLESRIEKSHAFLYVHLPDRTLVYDQAASRQVQKSIWFELTSSIVGKGQYRAKNFVWCHDKWYCGDTKESQIGCLTNSISSHYGEINGWEFQTSITYNKGGAIFHELELVALSGRVQLGLDPTLWTSYTEDGLTYSQERMVKAGKRGDRNIKIAWLQQGFMRHTRSQRFRGTSDAHLSVARLEARLEALNG